MKILLNETYKTFEIDKKNTLKVCVKIKNNSFINISYELITDFGFGDYKITQPIKSYEIPNDRSDLLEYISDAIIPMIKKKIKETYIEVV